MNDSHKRSRIAASLIFLFLESSFLPGSEARTYTTAFPGTESSISENGSWQNGKSTGLDWADDSTALLEGTWGPDQAATATVYSRNQKGGSVYEEVEIRLRSSLSPRKCTGYEILFRCLKGSDSYVQIVRWNGPLGSFTYLADQKGSKCGISNGDTVKATIIGNVITAYINNVPVAQATDDTYASGNPGMGFFLQGASAVNRDYGFSSFTASDEPDSLKPPRPLPNK
jgi:hypothetical protein